MSKDEKKPEKKPRKVVSRAKPAQATDSEAPCDCTYCQFIRAIKANVGATEVSIREVTGPLRELADKQNPKTYYEETWGVFLAGMGLKFFPSQDGALEELGENPNGLIAFKVLGVGATAPQGLRDAIACAGALLPVNGFNPRTPGASS
jgi:hypothetical protein